LVEKSLKIQERSVGDRNPEVLFANQLEKMNGLEREPFTVFPEVQLKLIHSEKATKIKKSSTCFET
jgi:hypothetical protein